MKNIIGIQHCESIHHTNGMIGSWTDWELSENGVKQAHNIGKKLSKELDGTKFVMYTSDLKRAKMTADIIASYLGVTPKIRENLRERNLGSACGKSVEWFRENQYPHEWNVDHRYLDDCETIREHYERIKPFYEEIISNNEENIIFVSHGGTQSLFNIHFMELPIKKAESLNIHTSAGSLSFYKIKDGVHFARKLGDTYYKQK